MTLQLGGGEWEPEAGDIIPQGSRVQVKGDLAGAVDTLEALGFRSFDSKYGRVIISYARGHGGWPLALVIDAKGKVVNGRLIGMER